VSGLIKTKVLLFGFLLVAPSVAVRVFRGSDSAASRPEIRPVSTNTPAESLQVPVEVMAKGSAPHWVYIEVTGQALPEPSLPRDSR